MAVDNTFAREFLNKNLLLGVPPSSKEWQNIIGGAPPAYRNVLQAARNDLVNFGGVTQQTLNAMKNVKWKAGGGDYWETKQRNWGQAIARAGKRANPITPGAGGGPGGQPGYIKTGSRPSDVSTGDFYRQYITNRLLPLLDEATRYSTQQYLARANPLTFGGYQNVLPPGSMGAPTAPQDQRQVLAQAIQKVKGGTATSPDWSGLEIGPEAMASSGWLKDYLTTAAQGLGPESTRAQQLVAQGHLGTLSKEAQADPKRLGQFLTLAENLVNPIKQKASLSGILGQGRAISSPSGQFKRKGFSFRNPTLL